MFAWLLSKARALLVFNESPLAPRMRETCGRTLISMLFQCDPRFPEVLGPGFLHFGQTDDVREGQQTGLYVLTTPLSIFQITQKLRGYDYLIPMNDFVHFDHVLQPYWYPFDLDYGQIPHFANLSPLFYLLNL